MTDTRHAAVLTDDEVGQLERANASGRTPVVLVHGLWLLGSSWDRWVGYFEDAGYSAVTPSWPDDPPTVEAAKADPTVFAGKSVGNVADHHEHIVRRLARKPAVIGHSFGGLLTQILAGRGLAAAAVAIDPAPHRGVLPLPISSLRSAFPVLRNPLNHGRRRRPHLRAVPLRLRQRRRRVRGPAAVREVQRRRSRRPAVPGGVRQPQPVVRGQGRHEEPCARPSPGDLGREGSHGAPGRSPTPRSSGSNATRA
jgi:pimeloyl-ACP methyl ester carboxylesterase